MLMKRNPWIHRKYILPFFLTSHLCVTSTAGAQNNDPSARKTGELSKLSCHQQVGIKEDKAMYDDYLQDEVNGVPCVENKI